MMTVRGSLLGTPEGLSGETQEKTEQKASEEKSVSELLADISADNKIDGKDKEDIDELSQRLNEDKERIYTDTKESLKESMLAMLENGYTVDSEDTFNAIKNLLSASAGINLPDYNSIASTVKDDKNKVFSLVHNSGSNKILVYRKESYMKDITDNTDEHGYISMTDGKFNQDTNISEFYTSFDDNLSNNNKVDFTKVRSEAEGDEENLAKLNQVRQTGEAEQARVLAEQKSQAAAEQVRVLAEQKSQAAAEQVRVLAEQKSQAEAEQARVLAEQKSQAEAEHARVLAEQKSQAEQEADRFQTVISMNKEYRNNMKNVDVLYGTIESKANLEATMKPLLGVGKASLIEVSTAKIAMETFNSEVKDKEQMRLGQVKGLGVKYIKNQEVYADLSTQFESDINKAGKSTIAEMDAFEAAMNNIDMDILIADDSSAEEPSTFDNIVDASGEAFDDFTKASGEVYDNVVETTAEAYKTTKEFLVKTFTDKDLTTFIGVNGETITLELDDESMAITYDTTWTDGISDSPIGMGDTVIESEEQAIAYINEQRNNIEQGYNTQVLEVAVASLENGTSNKKQVGIIPNKGGDYAVIMYREETKTSLFSKFGSRNKRLGEIKAGVFNSSGELVQSLPVSGKGTELIASINQGIEGVKKDIA
ncbi:hypothetical protein A9Q91_05880 [Candidatus Gracilibacteria bacterium 28_42_T64]|nr:hypothetical protein A9Q91_05880 [Candidatus Gracilibacteria bacterium 28_42_T64]